MSQRLFATATLALWALWAPGSFSAIAQNASGSGARPAQGSPLTRGPFLQMPDSRLSVLWRAARPLTLQVRFSAAEPWRTIPTRAEGRDTTARFALPRGLSDGAYRLLQGGKTLVQAPLPQPGAPGAACRFVVWGDSGVAQRGQWEVARQIEKQAPQFLVHTGDLVYPRGAAADYDAKFFRVYAPLLARAPFFGVLGNHDVMTQRGKPFLDAFLLPRNGPPQAGPERNYSFDWGDAHFVMLDSTFGEFTLKKFIAPWLEEDLRRSRALWKFVVFHHPPFTSGIHGDDLRIQRLLVPVLERSGVDVVFNGHDHLYERFAPRGGVTYIVSGAGGAPRYKQAHQSRSRSVRFFNGDWSFSRIDIQGRSLRGRQITRSGAVVDEWTLMK